MAIALPPSFFSSSSLIYHSRQQQEQQCILMASDDLQLSNSTTTVLHHYSPRHLPLPSSSKIRKTSQLPTFITSSLATTTTTATHGRRAYTSVVIVPTGVGASIGGYAGDALPVVRALSTLVDTLISHPNVLNAAMLYWPMDNVLYVEGYALDKFAQGEWGLSPTHGTKIGLVLDAAIEEELVIRHLQVVDSARASLGISVVDYVVTDMPLQVEIWLDPQSGKSTGRLGNPDSLLRAAQSLISNSQVDAIAVVGRFPDDDVQELSDYRQGKGVDLLAGVEAIISHLVVKEFQIPCAHAPALSPLPLDPSLCPRSAAEEIGYTFLPCVLAGLSKAPQYITRSTSLPVQGSLWASDVDSVILPFDACGGNGALAFARTPKKKPLIVAVGENETILDDTPDKLGIHAVVVSNYWEAIGVIAAHKAGIDPLSLRRDAIRRIRRSGASVSTSNGYSFASSLGMKGSNHHSDFSS